ncbi:hypothetical protein N657DRAFT_641545 [Parathielavia appendiculata]|uniref:Uncharacterized protein n=1 Tax=Parathielavia appendiculata TaxID=2587402 RepID=A0AAN6Z761_9PEZI|nr:hypothetical protein N657DRAFT_641545 [Parathielavia appendiculata]
MSLTPSQFVDSVWGPSATTHRLPIAKRPKSQWLAAVQTLVVGIIGLGHRLQRNTKLEGDIDPQKAFHSNEPTG